MFGGASRFHGKKPLRWHTGHCLDFSHMFAHTPFEGDVSLFDMRRARRINGMFEMAKSFDGDLSKWMTGHIHDFNATFAGAASFTGKGLENWNMTGAINTNMMFMRAEKFNADVSSWDMQHVKDMRNMMRHATSFNQKVCWHLNEHVHPAGIFYKSQGHFDEQCVDQQFISKSCCDQQIDPNCRCPAGSHVEPQGHDHSNDHQAAAGITDAPPASNTTQQSNKSLFQSGVQYLLAGGLAMVALAAAGIVFLQRRRKSTTLDENSSSVEMHVRQPYSDKPEDDDMEDVEVSSGEFT